MATTEPIHIERIRKLRMKVMAQRAMREMGEAIIHARAQGYDALADNLTRTRDAWARATAEALNG